MEKNKQGKHHTSKSNAMPIYFASDHAGALLRKKLLSYAQVVGYNTVDLGPQEAASVDYPDFGVKLAMALQNDQSARGIAICGSGIGISIALNRFSWVRAALVSDPEAAKLARQHNDANVMAFGERLIATETAKECVWKFLKTEFEGGRHQRRVDKLHKLGKAQQI